MKKSKEEILRDKKQSSVQPIAQSTEQHSVQSTEQSTEQHSVQSNGAIFMALVYLLSLPLALAYFLHITLLRPQIRNKSIKNNHQNSVICFRKIYNKCVVLIGKKTSKTLSKME